MTLLQEIVDWYDGYRWPTEPPSWYKKAIEEGGSRTRAPMEIKDLPGRDGTLRDEFMKAAFPSVLLVSALAVAMGGKAKTYLEMAQEAYMYADAMLVAKDNP